VRCLAALAGRRPRLNADHPTLTIGRQTTFGLVQQNQLVAERVANARTSADRDVEGRLHSLAARAHEKRERFIDILNYNIGFRADVEVHNELRVRVRESKADRFVTPPQHAMAEAIVIEGDGRVQIAGAKQKAIQLSKQWALGAHHMILSRILAARRALCKARSGTMTTYCLFENTLRLCYVRGWEWCRSDVPDMDDRLRLRRSLTDLIIDVFRLNGALLASGDALVKDLGLTSARWQVLGAIAFSPVPLPVAHLARNMGLTRQAVQRSVDEMRNDSLVRLDPNPHHKRAMLVTMTQRGESAFRAAMERQEGWADALAAGLPSEGVEAASVLLRKLQRRLDSSIPSATTAVRSDKEDA
jgi:DNA-binding MarR family transcriptional regulator